MKQSALFINNPLCQLLSAMPGCLSGRQQQALSSVFSLNRLVEPFQTGLDQPVQAWKGLNNLNSNKTCFKSSYCLHHAPETPTLSLYPPVSGVLMIKTHKHHPFLSCWTVCLDLLLDKEQQVSAAAAKPIARTFIRQVYQW